MLCLFLVPALDLNERNKSSSPGNRWSTSNISDYTFTQEKKKNSKRHFFSFYTKRANASVYVQMYVREGDVPSSRWRWTSLGAPLDNVVRQLFKKRDIWWDCVHLSKWSKWFEQWAMEQTGITELTFAIFCRLSVYWEKRHSRLLNTFTLEGKLLR